jgi:transposase
MSENPDYIEKHDPATCPTCNRSLKSAPRMPEYNARQVVDIPAIVSQTTEHQVFSKTCCNCGAISKGNFPVHVSQHVQYGPHLRAVATYLMNYQLLPYERTEELFKDLFGVAMSYATLARINQRSYEKLEGVETCIRQHILTQPVVHFDETGLFIDTKLHWLHIAGYTDATLYIGSEKRGQDGMDVMVILSKYGGVGIHDGWKTYWKYTCKHGLCNAHHLRELKFVIEQFSQHRRSGNVLPYSKLYFYSKKTTQESYRCIAGNLYRIAGLFLSKRLNSYK